MITKNYPLFKKKAGDSKYSLFDKSRPNYDTDFFHHVPLSAQGSVKRRILSYDQQGLRNLRPLSLTESNAAEHKGVIKNFVSLIPKFRVIIGNGQYPFIRMDINIYMTYLKVISCCTTNFLGLAYDV